MDVYTYMYYVYIYSRTYSEADGAIFWKFDEWLHTRLDKCAKIFADRWKFSTGCMYGGM
jgi:hypothetical protein